MAVPLPSERHVFGARYRRLRRQYLGKKKWAIVHSTDAFGTNGMKNLVEVLKRTGVEPVLIQGYTNNSQDFTPVALAVKQSGADVMGTYMPFPPDLGIFAKQLRQLGVNIAWVGSPSTAVTTALKLAGPALYGSYAVADSSSTQARRPRSSLPNTRRSTSLRPTSLGHGPTTRFTF